jgi:peroxiredoxin
MARLTFVILKMNRQALCGGAFSLHTAPESPLRSSAQLTKRNMNRTPSLSKFAPSALLMLCAGLAFGQSPKVSTNLTVDPSQLDFAGSRKAGEMYMPSSTKLSTERPPQVKKEPTYRTTPLYGVIQLGNGPKTDHVFALDAPKGEDAKIYVDLTGDGDLTTSDGSWQKKTVSDGIAEYDSTFNFRVSYGNASKENTHTTYGINFYWADGRSTVNYYRAGVPTGKITVGGEQYTVKIIDENNQALFNLPFEVGGAPTRPIYVCLDGARFDARGTFGFGGTNYLATISPDGQRLSLEATAKSVTPPVRTAEKEPDLLTVGTEAPDFEVPAWEGGTVRLSKLRGNVVVLDFWATWCGPCKASLPHVEKIQQQISGQKVYVLALNVFDDKAAYDQWVPANKQYTFHFAYDPAGRDNSSIAKSKYMVSGIPTTYVIDTDGKVSAAIVGYEGLDDHRLEQALAKLNVAISTPAAPKKSVPMLGLGGR